MRKVCEVQLDAPSLGGVEKRFLNKAVESGYISTIGPMVPRFEKAFADYLKVKKAVSTQSGTAALHMALHELGIGPADEVIVPALTFVATVNPVIYVGAAPVIVDVDRSTWNISPDSIERAITRKTKAIIPVHLYGSPCDMERIMTIAHNRKIKVIEDATESLGAKYHGRFTGTFGDMGCFSFNGNKIITTGGGGMIIGRDHRRIEHIRFLVNQAKDTARGFYHPEMGFNYRMTNIEAALGLAQFERLEGFLKNKRRFRSVYEDSLAGISSVKVKGEYGRSKGNDWLTCIEIAKKGADVGRIIRSLKNRGVQARRVFRPLCEMPYLKKYARRCPNAYEIYDSGLCLPSSSVNTVSQIRYAAAVLKEVLIG